MLGISRRLFAPSIALLSSVLLAAPIHADDNNRTLERAEFAFRVTVPTTWTDDKIVSKHTCVQVSQEGPKGCPASMFMVYVSDDEGLSDDTDLSAALHGSRKQTRKDFPNSTLSAPEKVTLDGLYAVRYTFTKTVEGHDYKVMYLMAIRHGRLYQLTVDADATQFDTVLPTAQKIIDSFKWTD